MSSTKVRKACVNCYQKKVRCNWSEASPICSYCTNHGLQCYLPDPTQPAQRIAVRDKLAEFDARLRRLEDESRKTNTQLTGPLLDFQNSLSHATAALGEGQVSVSPEWELLDGETDFIPPSTTRNNSTGHSSSYSMAQDGIPSATTPNHNQEHPIAGFVPSIEDGLHSDSSAWLPQQEHVNSEQRPAIKRYRGEESPWNVLMSGTASSNTALVTGGGSFNETVARLADEDRSTPPIYGPFHYDLLKEAPLLTPELVFEYCTNFVAEAPFPIVYWPNLKGHIEQGLNSRGWAGSGAPACALMFIAFGCSRVPGCNCEVYFQKAWNMLPQLLLEQDLWALKGLTLMVHYLQGGSLPEPCYTLLGSASRMAISLGFHRKLKDKTYGIIEKEEGKRCWWLCYILEKTFSSVLGRPSTHLEISEAEIPQPFANVNGNISPIAMRNGSFSESIDPDDEEAVCLFVDLIEVVRTREEILRYIPARSPNGEVQLQFSTKHESVSEIIAHWRASSRLRRPLDFDTSVKATLRATIMDLCHYNSIISLDRHLKRDFETSMSNETIQAARATIRLVAEISNEGMVMCLWMWLYYAFSASVVLFLDVVHNPLHSSAPLNLALISDLENLCAGIASYSPGAKRVMDVAREMNKIAFETMKAKAKRKAQDELGDGSGGRRGGSDGGSGSTSGGGRSGVDAGNGGNGLQRVAKRGRVHAKDFETGPGAAGMGLQLTGADGGRGIVQGRDEWHGEHGWIGFPPNFSWDDWDQWLNDTSL